MKIEKVSRKDVEKTGKYSELIGSLEDMGKDEAIKLSNVGNITAIRSAVVNNLGVGKFSIKSASENGDYFIYRMKG